MDASWATYGPWFVYLENPEACNSFARRNSDNGSISQKEINGVLGSNRVAEQIALDQLCHWSPICLSHLSVGRKVYL